MTKSNVPTYTLIVGAKAIDKAIASITNRGAKLDRDIQIAALSAMQHHVEHGDVTLINRLVSAMPKGSRVKRLSAFINAFGAVVYDWESKTFRHDKCGVFNVEAAMAVMWTDYEPPVVVEGDAAPKGEERQWPEKVNSDAKPYKPVRSDSKRVNDLIDLFEKDLRTMGVKSNVSRELYAGLCELVDRTPVTSAHEVMEPAPTHPDVVPAHIM